MTTELTAESHLLIGAVEARCRSTTKEMHAGSAVDQSEPLTYFHSKYLPQMSLDSLVECMVDAGIGIDWTTAAMAVVLMQRYRRSRKWLLTVHMMHRLTIAALLVAAKVHQDRFPSNQLLAASAGLTLEEVNRLERSLIRSLDWRLVVTCEDLKEEVRSLLGDA